MAPPRVVPLIVSSQINGTNRPGGPREAPCVCSKYCTRRATATCLDLKRSAPMLVPNHTHVLIWYGDIHGPEPDKSMQYSRGPQYCTCLQAKTIAHVIWARGVWGGGTEGWRRRSGAPSRIMHYTLLHNASSPQRSCILL